MHGRTPGPPPNLCTIYSIIVIVIVALTFIRGLLSGAEAAADGCGKIIGFIVVAALIIAWILGLL